MPESSPNVTQIAPKRRKITRQDIEAVCKLVAKGLNEREAAAMLDIKDETWYKWKQRHQSQFDRIFTKIKSHRIDNLLSRIETHANGSKADGIRSDWRASHALLAMTDSRFAANKPEPSAEQKTPMIALISSDLAASVFGKLLPAPTEQKAIVEAQMVSDTKPLGDDAKPLG